MTVAVDMGLSPEGRPVTIDLEELLATRLLVQGNSGSGKSHLLRRLLEKSAGQVQQIVIDPEGDFVTLAGPYGHLAIEAAEHDEKEIVHAAARIREHRASVVLSLEGLEAEGQMRCAAAFLSALFEAPREHWYPSLVVVDEAQLFAPSGGGEVAEDVRRASLSAMTNLMCRGRKRGLAGIIATQRLAKLAKNVAAEASNFLMGRTFLDIDMARAADLLGMERRQAEAIRDLPRGTFLALGPAISRRPLSVAIGEVETRARSMSPKLVPLPVATPSGELQGLLFDLGSEEGGSMNGTQSGQSGGLSRPFIKPGMTAEDSTARTTTVTPGLTRGLPASSPSETLLAQLAATRSTPAPALPAKSEEEQAEAVTATLQAMVTDADSSARSAAVLYQDFTVRLRMAGVAPVPLDLPAFARRLAMARAGIFTEDPDWRPALEAAQGLPDDMLGPFLLLARAAREHAPTPSDEAIAQSYGTASLSTLR